MDTLALQGRPPFAKVVLSMCVDHEHPVRIAAPLSQSLHFNFGLVFPCLCCFTQVSLTLHHFVQTFCCFTFFLCFWWLFVLFCLPLSASSLLYACLASPIVSPSYPMRLPKFCYFSDLSCNSAKFSSQFCFLMMI